LSLFNALQLGLAAVALTMIVQRLRLLLFVAPLDADAFLEALTVAATAREFSLARRITRVCAPAFIADLAAIAIAELERGRAPRAAIEEAYTDFVHASSRGHDAIAALGRMASPLALIGVVVELGRAFSGGGGLLALQRGLVMRIGLERSLLTFALGLATAVTCAFALSILRRSARALGRDLRRVATALEELGRDRLET
jgi:biopolymer transport protein ExbB/TolQ